MRVIAADADPDVRRFYSTALARLGHQVLIVERGRQLVEVSRLFHPELVIAATELGGIEAGVEINRKHPTPVILVVDPTDLPHVVAADCFFFCLTKPVREIDLVPAIALAVRQFQSLQSARKEVADLQQALADRKLIERAKGIIIRRLRVGEEEAYHRLRLRAVEEDRKMVDVARRVLEAEEMFRLLEGEPDWH
jgi:response regulator NasT